MPAAMLQIGERIRVERARKGISLRSLARSVGLSPSLISQIETGKCQPSVSTLYAITTALGVSVQDVFGEASPPAAPMAVGQVTLPAPAPRGAGEAGGPVVCPGQREVIEFDSGVIWQRLGRVPGSHVDFLLVSYEPGGCSSPAGRLMQHPGTEYGYLIQGELTVALGGLLHRLAPGDAVSFASVTPHAYRNEGTAPAVGVWFVVPSDGP
ncbi:MAG TPA: cupin domain-containing protein [Streptosporangiaceae bacterium]|nr:cupin domain-containing protein [Streptosporangiaceae bacterium]